MVSSFEPSVSKIFDQLTLDIKEIKIDLSGFYQGKADIIERIERIRIRSIE